VLLFSGAVLWQHFLEAGAADDFALAADTSREAWSVAGDVEAEQLFGGAGRRLDNGTCSCPLAETHEDIGMIMVSSGHLTKKASYNALCARGTSVCIAEDQRWMLALYILGILYMFMALAIVCDEFFVPSLEYFCDAYEISMDVAGATFMAAGGSMPELFTSFIGTVKGNSVGIAAIVGSAVFNVLFVIATCAVASEEVLTLTWWPLARDCTYYMLTLITLALAFSGPWSKDVVEPWEAGILLLEYFGYCLFMKNNSKIYAWVSGTASTPGDAAKVHPADSAVAEDAWNDRTSTTSKANTSAGEKDKGNTSFVNPSTFRTGIVQLLVQNEHIADTAGMAAVLKVAGSLRETFDHIDKDHSGHIDEQEFRQLLEELGLSPESKSMDSAWKGISRNQKGEVGFEEFKKWYMASEARIEIKMRRIFEKCDRDGNGFIEHDEVYDILKGLGHKPSEEDVLTAMGQMLNSNAMQGSRSGVSDVSISDVDAPPQEPNGKTAVDLKSAHVTFEDFSTWYTNSLFWHEQEKHCQAEEQITEGGFSIDMPSNPSHSTRVWYAVTYPLCASMYITMPDVRKPHMRSVRMAVLGFIGSLMWILFFSVSLVEWTEVVSNSVGIPLPVAAVTVLAAGTSIPDLLSSYIVAKLGEGDMAVSSSIGSNIFDVTVGLPLPWLLWSLYHGGRSIDTIDANGIGFFISLLVVMIACVILTVKALHWQMTKTMGYVMFFLYFLFITLFLLVQMPEETPILTPPF